MRKSIKELISSGISAYQVSKDTGITLSVVQKIFNGTSKLENISLKNAEILSKYYKKMEGYRMSELLTQEIGKYVILEKESLDYWNIGLYEAKDMTVTNNLGVQTVWISKFNVEIQDEEKVIYAVQLETAAEITNWNKGEETVINDLIEQSTYDLGSMETVAYFYKEDDAFVYAKEKYPPVDLRALIIAKYAK